MRLIHGGYAALAGRAGTSLLSCPLTWTRSSR
jgi:hypothetical protein